jgi:ElaB/YqjD/DUF883 family membrane-anchored ribosome-binding protein
MTQATDQPGQQEGLKDQAAAKVQDATSVAQEKASELREQGSVRLRDQFDQRSNRAGSEMRSLAGALRRSGNDLSNEGKSNAAQLTGQAADRFERLGSYLEEKRGEELMRDVEAFARRRPWMLAGIGMLAGLAAARFMKASSERRFDSYRQASQQWPIRTESGYGRPLPPADGGGLLSDPAVAGSDRPGPLSDDPLARDSYAGGR